MTIIAKLFFFQCFLKLTFTEINISAKYFTFAKSTVSDKMFQWKNAEQTSVRKIFYFYYTCVTILSFPP